MKKNFSFGTNEIIIPQQFYLQNSISLAKKLLGKILVRNLPNGKQYFIITETEAYFGEKDKACHCRKGKTPRTEVMYKQGGTIYVYLIYGMYWMLNIVSGKKNHPEAVLIRGIQKINVENNKISLGKLYDGPGKTGKILQINKKDFNGKNIYDTSTNLYIIDTPFEIEMSIKRTPRIGINYAGKPWTEKLWRFIAEINI